MRQTKIEWCDHTFNAWSGCTKISPACDHCYAEALSRRFSGTFGGWGPGAERKRASPRMFQAIRGLNAAAARNGIRRRVFANSMSDVFDNQVPEEWRAEFFKLIAETPALDWLILTKRPQNAAKLLPAAGKQNLWLGVTAENQREHNRRVPILRAIEGPRVKFICVEPMLAPVRLDLRGIDWTIVGGESGPGARYMQPDWARDVRDQCRAANVALFVKQMSRREPIPPDLMIREFPATPA